MSSRLIQLQYLLFSVLVKSSVGLANHFLKNMFVLHFHDEVLLITLEISMVPYQNSKPRSSELLHPLTSLTQQGPTFLATTVPSAVPIMPFYLPYMLIPKSLEPNIFSGISQLISC